MAIDAAIGSNSRRYRDHRCGFCGRVRLRRLVAQAFKTYPWVVRPTVMRTTWRCSWPAPTAWCWGQTSAAARKSSVEYPRCQPMSSGADVTLSLDAATPLPDNVEASVELPSALGNPFIRLLVPEVPSGSMLSDGDTIPESRTEIGPQVESALATLGTVLTGSGFDQLDTVVRELNTAFSGRSGEVRSLTDTLTSLMAEASSHRSEFDEAVDLAARVSSQLAGQRDVVDNYLDSVPQVVSILVGQKDQIAGLLNSTVQLATNANTILDSSPNGLDAMLHDASTVVGTLDSFNSEIGQTLTNMNGLLENFTGAVQGDYLVSTAPWIFRERSTSSGAAVWPVNRSHQRELSPIYFREVRVESPCACSTCPVRSDRCCGHPFRDRLRGRPSGFSGVKSCCTPTCPTPSD